MTTSRKRPSSGFTAKSPEDLDENISSEDSLIECIETVDETEVIAQQFKEESIVPVDDFGPRFLEAPATEVIQKETTPAAQPLAPKRHPRNIPKFSRLAK